MKAEPAVARSRWRDPSGLLIELLLFAAIAFAALAYGAVQLWAESILHLIVAALVVILVVRQLFRRTPYPKPGVLAVVAVLGLALVYVQSIPLGTGLLEKLSPGTADLYAQLLPDRAEQFITEAGSAVEPTRPSTLSLYPFATRTDFHRLLTYVGLFLVAMLCLNTIRQVQRLCLFLAGFGGLLALFALVQRYTWNGRIFWIGDGTGLEVMGPFVNRNHYAGFINLCLMASLGLILARLGRPGWWRDESGRRHPGALRSGRQAGATALLVAAAGLMAASVLVSLSRGGVLALLLVGLVVLVVLTFQSLSGLQRVVVPVVVILGGGFVLWFGWGQMHERMITVAYGADWHWQHTPRLQHWADSILAAPRFFVFGTGSGTYELANSLFATRDWQGAVFVHAENEYLQTLVETGILGAALLGVGLLLLVIRGFRYALGSEDAVGRMLGVGLLMGMLTMVIHSFTDFHFRIPANAALFIVLAGSLNGLWIAHHRRAVWRREHKLDLLPKAGPGAEARRWTPARAAVAVVGSVLLLAGSAAVGMEARNALQAGLYWRQFELVEARYEGKSRRPKSLGDFREGLDRLQRAIAARPQEVAWHWRVARLYMHGYDVWAEAEGKHLAEGNASYPWPPQDMRRLKTLGSAVRKHGADKPSVMRHLAGWPGTSAYLIPGARHLLAARAACPTSSQIHIGLADLAFVFQDGAERIWFYCAAAQRAGPARAQVWYRTGLCAYSSRQRDRAWEWWRRSLALSNQYLFHVAVVARRSGFSGPEVARRLELRDPVSLYELAQRFYPAKGYRTSHYRLLQRVVELFDEVPFRNRSEKAVIILARACRSLGKNEQAREAYSEAVARVPDNLKLRFEYTQVLCDLADWDEAHWQARVLCNARPQESKYIQLMQRVSEQQLIRGTGREGPASSRAADPNGPGQADNGQQTASGNPTRL